MFVPVYHKRCGSPCLDGIDGPAKLSRDVDDASGKAGASNLNQGPVDTATDTDSDSSAHLFSLIEGHSGIMGGFQDCTGNRESAALFNAGCKHQHILGIDPFNRNDLVHPGFSFSEGPRLVKKNHGDSSGLLEVLSSHDEDAGIGHVDQNVKGVVLDGIPPSQDNAMNGSYPVVRKPYMNTKGDPPELVKVFIEYILGPDGAVIIAKSAYLPLK
jgi:hypothetical protein